MKVVVFVHPDTDAFWTQVSLGGIAEEIARKRYSVVYADVEKVTDIDLDRIFADEPRRLLLYIGNSAHCLPADLQYLTANGVHVILVNHETDLLTGNCSKVLLDYRGGMYTSVQYLCAHGRKRIALFGINPCSSTDLVKKQFFTEYLLKNDGSPERDIYYNHANVQSCIAAFLQSHTLYNAVICANDIVALALIRALTKEGVRVPEDLSIVGFDDIPLSRYTTPPLTTVRQNRTELGKSAFYALTSLMNSVPISTLLLHAELIVRESSGPAPGAPLSP